MPAAVTVTGSEVACKEVTRPAAPSMESVGPGMAMTATAFVVVATMMVMAGAMTASYGLRAPAMSRSVSPTWSA
jgi:hypothetical protein